MFSPNYINTKNTMKILAISLTKAQSVHYANIFEQMTMPNFTWVRFVLYFVVSVIILLDKRNLAMKPLKLSPKYRIKMWSTQK